MAPAASANGGGGENQVLRVTLDIEGNAAVFLLDELVTGHCKGNRVEGSNSASKSNSEL